MRYTLTILEQQFEELSGGVFSVPGIEGAAYLLCGNSVTEGETRLLVREVHPVADHHYLVREPYRLSIDSASYAAIAKRARAMNASVVFVHGHPGGPDDFSEQDDREEPKLHEFLAARAPGKPHGSFVITPQGRGAARVWGGHGWAPVARVRVIGGRFRFMDNVVDEAPLPEFFDRQVRAFGPEVQRLLKRLHVGVVGVGGTGSPVIEMLARLGVGTISEFDGDAFDATNVSRVYGSKVKDGGRNKTKISAAHIREIGLGTVVRSYARHITEEEAAKRLRECDIIIGCTDRHAPRGILVQLALRYLIPVLDTAVKIDAPDEVIRGVFGRVTTIIPGEACLFCRGRISPEMIRLESLSPEEQRVLADEGYAPQLEGNNPAVIPFTTAVAAQAVSEFVHRLTGFMGEERRSSEVLMLFHESSVRKNRTPPEADCLCSQRELWGRGDGRDFLGLTWPKLEEESEPGSLAA